ncbi:MAG: M24 family metallopeptidase [Acidobacteriota bacterium]
MEVRNPVFTVAERDRRWATVRANMAKPSWNLDAIITAASDQTGANARYLSQVVLVRYSGAGPQVLFPRDAAKKVYVQVTAARHVEEWTGRLAQGGWLADGRMVLTPETGGAAMAKLLAAEGFGRPGTRIGVAKLKGTRFEPDGVVSATYLDTLRAALPGVLFLPIEQWGPDAGPIDEAMLTKSGEEQDAIRRAVAANERGLTAMVGALRGGATRQGDLWWAAYASMVAATGSDIIRLSIGIDQGGNATLGEPVADSVSTGQFCSQEISSGFQGYGCQINHTFFVGGPSTPGYDYYQAAVEAGLTLHRRALAFIRPGRTTYDEFEKNARQIVADLGAQTSGVMVHSGGIGQARPRGGGDSVMVIQPGHAFDFKPGVTLVRDKSKDARERNRAVQIGESYVVTDTSVVRLGSRTLGPISTGDAPA